jgi:hypothetical protein
MFSVEFEPPPRESSTNIFRPMWTPLDPDEHSIQTARQKHVLKTTSDDVFIRLYYAGLSILGVYIVFSILRK